MTGRRGATGNRLRAIRYGFRTAVIYLSIYYLMLGLPYLWLNRHYPPEWLDSLLPIIGCPLIQIMGVAGIDFGIPLFVLLFVPLIQASLVFAIVFLIAQRILRHNAAGYDCHCA